MHFLYQSNCSMSDTTYYIDSSATEHNLYWLYHVLQLLCLDEYSRDSAVPGLNREDAYQNFLPVPPIEEQRVIAENLILYNQRLDSVVEGKQKLIELLKEQRAAIINQAVTKGLNPDVKMKDSGVEWLGEIPEHWEVKKLKYVANLRSGQNIISEEIDEEGAYPVYGGNGLRGYFSKFTHDGNYILIGRQGALCGNINYAKGKFWASEHAVVVALFNGQDLLYIGELLRTMNLNQYSRSAAQPGLAVDTIINQIIPVPSYAEQMQIARYIDQEISKIDQLIIRIKRQIELLQEYRIAIISETVTGKIDVRAEVEL